MFRLLTTGLFNPVSIRVVPRPGKRRSSWRMKSRQECCSKPRPSSSSSAARCNTHQVEIRFRKLDDLSDTILVAQGHNVTPTARIGRIRSQSPPVDVPGLYAECLRRSVGVGEFYFVIASQFGLNSISPFRATKNRITQNLKVGSALG